MATSGDVVVFARDELDLIVSFAGCSLDEKPGSNWVQKAGGLPNYVCHLARAIKKTGKTTSQAIAIALSRIKVWATGKGVDKDTQAKAAAAVSEWEALRAKNHAKTTAKDTVKATGQGEILVLSNAVTVFNVDSVRNAWSRQNSAWVSAYQSMYPQGSSQPAPMYSYVREMWTDHLIVKADDEDGSLFRVDYTVDDKGEVTFAQPVQVKVQYVTVDSTEMVGDQMSNSELRQLMASVGPCHSSATDTMLLSISANASALDKVLARPHRRTAVETFLELTGTGG